MKTEKNRPYRLMTPGPVPLSPIVREILGQPMIHHRTPEFEKVLKSVGQKLKKTFLTSQPVFMHASTGTGAMQSALTNTLNPGDKVLAIVSGKFGERWAKMSEIIGCQVSVMNVEWGSAVKVEDVAEFLKKNPDTRAVLCQACETSTATQHPIEALGKLISEYKETLFIVDAITGLGAMPLPMDEWHLDVVISGSQKAFQLPTGLSFIALSAKAWNINKNVKKPDFYFDLRLEKKAIEKGETHFSSVVPLVRALDSVLDGLVDDRLEKAIKRSQLLAQVTRDAGQLLKCPAFSKSPASSVTALMVPEGVDGQALRDLMESKYYVTVMGGQDQLKGKILRIGHLGYITNDDMCATFGVLSLALIELGFNPPLDPEKIMVFVRKALGNSEVPF